MLNSFVYFVYSFVNVVCKESGISVRVQARPLSSFMVAVPFGITMSASVVSSVATRTSSINHHFTHWKTWIACVILFSRSLVCAHEEQKAKELLLHCRHFFFAKKRAQNQTKCGNLAFTIFDLPLLFWTNAGGRKGRCRAKTHGNACPGWCRRRFFVASTGFQRLQTSLCKAP